MKGSTAAAAGAGARRWQLEVGEELGPWRVVGPLGAGGMGEVYVAEHAWLPTRRAALKVLVLERAGSKRFADRFRAEAALLASIDHPNVVRLYDAQITDDGRAWMAMELLAGRALNELLAAHRQTDIPDTLQILSDVADGAHAAHLLGIVHRDLKPGNIFITSKHVAKVLDFGISKLVEHRLTLRRLAPSTEQNLVLGTIPYMSPEQLLGQGLDHRSDIYALGVIAYQMLTGHHPFVPGDEQFGPEQLGYRALFTEPTPIHDYLPSCPMELWHFLRTTFARKRDERPSSMAKVAEKMRALRGAFLAERGLPIAALGALLGAAVAHDEGPGQPAGPNPRDAGDHNSAGTLPGDVGFGETAALARKMAAELVRGAARKLAADNPGARLAVAGEPLPSAVAASPPAVPYAAALPTEMARPLRPEVLGGTAADQSTLRSATGAPTDGNRAAPAGASRRVAWLTALALGAFLLSALTVVALARRPSPSAGADETASPSADPAQPPGEGEQPAPASAHAVVEPAGGSPAIESTSGDPASTSSAPGDASGVADAREAGQVSAADAREAGQVSAADARTAGQASAADRSASTGAPVSAATVPKSPTSRPASYPPTSTKPSSSPPPSPSPAPTPTGGLFFP